MINSIVSATASTYTVQARDERGAWQTACTDPSAAAAQATASYIARRYEVETRVIARETGLAHPGTAGFNANRCPACEEPCGDLLDGLCLGCRIDWDNHTISDYEATEADAFWDAAARATACGRD